VETWGWWTLARLVADIVGTIVVVSAVLTSKERAIEAGVPRLGGVTDEQNLELPAVSDRLNQSRRAAIGVSLLVAGFGLQAIGALLVRRASLQPCVQMNSDRRLRERLDALGPAPRAELLHVLMLPDFERADRIGEFWGNPESRAFAELLIDCEEDRTLRAVLVGMLREMERSAE
jgi:hypothetical protein